MLGLMGFMFFFLLGFMAMFFYFIKKQESLFRQLSDEHAQLRVLLRAMECRLDHMAAENFQAPETEGAPDSEEKDEQPGHDPLLHLSFEEPRSDKIDPALDLKMDVANQR